MPGLKSTYVRSILILNLFVILRTLAMERPDVTSLAGDFRAASEEGFPSPTLFSESGTDTEDSEEENVLDEIRAKKKSKKPFISGGISRAQQRLEEYLKSVFMYHWKTQAINSPYPEKFSIPDIRKLQLGTSEFPWADYTLSQFEPLIQFAEERKDELTLKWKLPAFHDTISRDLQASSSSSSIEAQSVEEKLKCLDRLIQLKREMKELCFDIDREVDAILDLFPQPDGPINSIKINLGSAESPLASLKYYTDFITVVELFGSNTIREVNIGQGSQNQIKQLCNDLGLEEEEVMDLIRLQEDLKTHLAIVKGPDVTKAEYLKIEAELDKIPRTYKDSEENFKVAATKQLQNLLAPFPFMYRYIDCAAQFIPDKWGLTQSIERGLLTGASTLVVLLIGFNHWKVAVIQCVS
ncbi:hypothetical protein CROQUDRAFT_602246 [Cronartium quercuum f. sp. fusiforme G11]|uniref:Uncharacterized protein n=1 Tax=Cronartium quercuum f. sp. fusiforme G11 TaxID=708437 RepID=A0A9P6NX44_9BASI|nr:hypothetical protein CROQUDRAFT_602246 [Cronartium quercuum f. sp. fusiforme G11]